MKNNLILVAAITAVIFAGAGFYGGMQYQISQTPATTRTGGAGGFGGRTGGRGPGNGGGRIMGTVTSSDSNSLTVKLQDGSSKILLITSQTSINKAAQASASDLVVGSTVAAFGSTNSDGSVTAQNIQLNPIQMRPGGETSPTPTP